jgi:spore coat protein U-like protein
MKLNKRILALGLAVACASMGSVAFAGGSHTITVNATVTGTCKFNTAASTIALAVDPTATSSVTGTDNVLYRCTNGTVPGFTLTSSSTSSTTGGNLIQGAENFPYTFTSSGGGAGTGMGNLAANDKTLAVTVSVNQSGAANVTPGTYSDTIVVDVTP